MASPSGRRSMDSSDPPSPTSTLRSQKSYFAPANLVQRENSPRTSIRRESNPSNSGGRAQSSSAHDSGQESRSASAIDPGHNAISTLLQPPIVRTGLVAQSSLTLSHKPPSSRDIPPVTLTNIHHVDPSIFKSYLSQMGNLYEAFHRAKAEPEGASSQIFRKKKDEKKKDDFTEILERRLQKDSPQKVRHGSITSLTSSDTPRRKSSVQGKRNLYSVTPLSTIPNVYFDESFHLDNPRTFDIVSERAEVVRPLVGSPNLEKAPATSANGAPTTGRKALVTNAILQEKLSWYMDTVEVHLISSISAASTSFFAALGSLRELESEAAGSVSQIQSLRANLGQLDQEMAVGSLKIVAMKQRRDNLRQLSDATKQLQCVVKAISHCEDLIESEDLETALDRMDVSAALIAGNLSFGDAIDLSWLQPRPPSNLRDLSQLRALDGVPEGMRSLKARIGRGFESKFLNALITDLRDHVRSVPPRDTLQRWSLASQRTRGDHVRSQSAFPAYMQINTEFRQELLAAVRGLSRAEHTSAATSSLKDIILREMKSIIRRHLPSSSDDDAESMTSSSTRGGRQLSQQDKSSVLSRNLRELDPEMAEELLCNVYTNVGEALRRLSFQVKILLDVTSGVSSGAKSPGLKSPRTPVIEQDSGPRGLLSPEPRTNLQEELLQSLDLTGLLGQAVDAAQSQIVKVLRVRTESTTRLPLQRFIRYFTLNRQFADECEAISGRPGGPLKAVVNAHISDFVSKMCEAEKQSLAQAMDADRWEAKDVGSAESEVLARILEGMTSDPATWLKELQVSRDLEEAVVNGEAIEKTNGTGKEKLRTASIEDEKFILVESAMAALRGIERFELLIACIPSISMEVSSSLLDYLKLFNSRSYQLILGAGATRSVGLKNINTKHLALGSQALSFLISLMPYIREFVRRHSSSAASLGDFDKVKRLFQEHQGSIHDKLVEIMTSRASTHVKAMKKIDFDAVADKDVSLHMETLTKDTTTLHRVLCKHLPDMTVNMIMTPVFTSYRQQWAAAFEEVPVTTAAGKARLLRDAQLLEAKLGKIEGADDIGRHLADIVNAKPIASEPEDAEEDAEDENPEPGPTASAAGTGTSISRKSQETVAAAAEKPAKT